ncbi:MAG: glycosyltransferase, partial [Deltaproteobacteria bacterium]|nr:glycosyltransferase [Deltaproteobacteria bacterium]
EVPRGSDLGLVDGENYVAITEENVEEKIAYYLAHPEEARTVAARGFELAQRLHNCHARAVQFLESLEGTPFSVHAHRRSRQLRYLPEVYSPLKGLKLHLGCGGDYRSGWINVDRDPGARADIHAPIEDLNKYFAPSSAREALAVHALNYLRLWEARAFFRSMHRILEPGGKLVLETVNLERAIEKISQSKENFPEYLEGVRALHAFGLDHLEANEPYYPNSFSWTPWHLERELQLAGFSKIEFLPPTMHGQWRDMRVEATNSAPLVTRQGHVRSDDDPSVLFLFDSAMGQATAHTRAMRFQGHFERAGWRTGFLDFHKSGPEAAIAAAKSFDIVYLLKIASLSVVDRIRRETSARIVFDLTDALWAPLHRQHGWADLEGVLLRCDAVFSENQYVCEYASRYCDTVISLPVPTLVEDFEIARRERSSAPRSDVIFGWVGSSGTVAALTKIRPALAKVFRAHPECVLRVVGCHRQFLPDFPDMRVSVLESYNEEVMVREMLDLDIGLFPPPFDDDDFAIRGSQKALLYMAGGVATIAQRGGDCERFIEDGVTGMLATTESEWAEKLEQLVRDHSLRNRLGDAARQSASVGRSTQAIFECLCDAFRRVAAK